MKDENNLQTEVYDGKWWHHPEWYKIKSKVLQYPLDFLVSVCKKCHEKMHGVNYKQSEEEAREFLKKKEQEEAESEIYDLFMPPNSHEIPRFKIDIDPPEELRRKVIRGNPDTNNPDFDKELNGWSEDSKKVTSACIKRRDASQEKSYRIVLDMVTKSEKECGMHVPKCEICSFMIRYAEANGAYEAFIESKRKGTLSKTDAV